MAEPLRHRQTKEAATDMLSLQPPRHIPTLPKRRKTQYEHMFSALPSTADIVRPRPTIVRDQFVRRSVPISLPVHITSGGFMTSSFRCYARDPGPISILGSRFLNCRSGMHGSANRFSGAVLLFCQARSSHARLKRAAGYAPRLNSTVMLRTQLRVVPKEFTAGVGCSLSNGEAMSL